MTNFQYIDDLYIDFYRGCSALGLNLSRHEEGAALNFYHLLYNNEPLTIAQSLYVMRILNSHKDYLENLNIDIKLLSELKFKNPFRVKDNSKKIDVEFEEKDIWLVVKQPFEFKDKFEEACVVVKNPSFNSIIWDNESKIKKYNFDVLNCMLVKEFGFQNAYEMSPNFLNLVDEVEIIWNNQKKYLKKSKILNNQIVLENSSDSATNYFQSNKTNNINDDLFLAKSLGHPLEKEKKENLIEIICSSSNRFFHTTDFAKIVEICKSINGKICLLINREQIDTLLIDMIELINQSGISKNQIKIGFRTGNQEKPEFNKWVKNNGHGGNIADGKILVFREKPPKWLIKEPNFVKLYVTTASFAPSSSSIQSWFYNQSCIIFLGPIKPTLIGDRIVDEL